MKRRERAVYLMRYAFLWRLRDLKLPLEFSEPSEIDELARLSDGARRSVLENSTARRPFFLRLLHGESLAQVRQASGPSIRVGQTG